MHQSIVLFLNLVHKILRSEVPGALLLFFTGCCKGKETSVSYLSSHLRKHMLMQMKMKADQPTTACSFMITKELGLPWAPLAAAVGLWMT